MPQTSRTDGVCAIVLHAGAGYHSPENEHKHLKACEMQVVTLPLMTAIIS